MFDRPTSNLSIRGRRLLPFELDLISLPGDFANMLMVKEKVSDAGSDHGDLDTDEMYEVDLIGNVFYWHLPIYLSSSVVYVRKHSIK